MAADVGRDQPGQDGLGLIAGLIGAVAQVRREIMEERVLEVDLQDRPLQLRVGGRKEPPRQLMGLDVPLEVALGLDAIEPVGQAGRLHPVGALRASTTPSRPAR